MAQYLLFQWREYRAVTVIHSVVAIIFRLGSINWTAWSSHDMCVNWNEL